MNDVLLDIKQLNSGYGNIQILWDIKISVKQGEMFIIFGPNGAGKSTLIKSIIGQLRCWSGEINFRGEDISRDRVYKRMQKGITYMSEVGCFTGLTIKENLIIGGRHLRKPELNDEMEKVFELFPVLRQKIKDAAGSLSGGQRKMLGIAKALISQPDLIIMDEPSAGLSPLLVGETIGALEKARESGVTFLLSEQNIRFAELADSACVLEGGRIRFNGPIGEMKADASLMRSYFALDT